MTLLIVCNEIPSNGFGVRMKPNESEKVLVVLLVVLLLFTRVGWTIAVQC